MGHRLLLLDHRGRRSGRSCPAVLEVVRFDPARGESVVVSGYGRRADWFRNVPAGGAVSIETGGRRFRPAWRLLNLEEADEVIVGYERRYRLIRPVVRRGLSW